MDGLVQERLNSIVNALELLLSCTNPSICGPNSLFHAKWHFTEKDYRKTSNISRTLVGNIFVDNSDVVGAAPTTSSFST